MNLQQRRFCDEYLIDLNGTQAAIRAGYSPRSAHSRANKLLRREDVQGYIRKRVVEKESRLIAKQNEVLAYLSGVMRREVKEQALFVRKQKRSYWAEGEDGKMHRESVEEDRPEVIEAPVKLADANRAAELLGRYYTLFSERSADAQEVAPVVIEGGEQLA